MTVQRQLVCAGDADHSRSDHRDFQTVLPENCIVPVGEGLPEGLAGQKAV
jgi:hypothetical protein